MSIQLMTKIWKMRDIKATTKLILLKLADNANDEGFCWPKVQTLALQCCAGHRTVQGAISWAEEHKILTREQRLGRSTIYHLHPDLYVVETPADLAPPQNSQDENIADTPAENDMTPPQISHPTPADLAPTYIEEPSSETSKETSPNLGEENLILFAWDCYNKMAEDAGLQKAVKLTKKRKELLRDRIKDCGGGEEWIEAMRLVSGSPYLCGENDHNFKADLDFILREDKFVKLLEGGYRDRNAVEGSPTTVEPVNIPKKVLEALRGSGARATEINQRFAGVIFSDDGKTMTVPTAFQKSQIIKNHEGALVYALDGMPSIEIGG